MTAARHHEMKDISTHTYSDGEAEWQVERLWGLAEGLPVVEMEPEAFHEWHRPEFGPTWLETASMAEYAGHIQRVLDADLSYPVIVSAEGNVMDGNHRLMRAFLDGVKVKMVRFEETPEPDRVLKTD